jgi:isopentenyl-diphosphate Delta-isomerase
MSTARPADELVVLLDEDGRRTGTALKAEVHTDRTPLHLAFSCYLFDGRGRLLLTRRAEHKRTWPGVWTNSFCGHPAPDEDLPAAVRRRAEQELGLEVTDVVLVLPAFRYQAVMADGTRENEMCPVYVARADAAARPDPEEVSGTSWEPWSAFSAAVLAGERDISPWCRQQVADLVAVLGPEWKGTPLPPPADPVGLPDAARRR